MSYLQIAGLKISYGDKVVLHNIDLQVEKGEMIALLGPSGCGKTTLLNALCGFIPVQTGEIAVAHRDITHSAPEQRNITMVFQSYALWPHLTVARNIGYGLKLRKWRRDDIDRRVTDLLNIVNLTGLADVKVTNFPAGSASVSLWRGPWRLSRTCWCWMNRCRISMPKCASMCAMKLKRCKNASDSPH
jgi:ABC-type sugar transport system ATPase subunit